MNNKILVGMSGGVDSSVAVSLLQKEGYNVVGATLQLVPQHMLACSVSAESDAQKVAKALGIEHMTINDEDSFKDRVIDYFVSEYVQGRTPNPCIVCNRYIKFEDLINKAKELGIEKIATGHYAKVEFDQENGRYLLKKSNSQTKDQTYMLYRLTQDQLSKVVFPLGNYNKDEVRHIADELKLPVANKPDSQEVCFIYDDNYTRFIQENTDTQVRSGYFVDTNGSILGKHKGIYNYTVGQRRGLGIVTGKPMYVVEIDIEKNEIVLGDEAEIFSDHLIAVDPNFISMDKLTDAIRVTAKVRYGAKDSPALITPLSDGTIDVKFDNPQRAITSGQSVVFYQDDVVLGGGFIQ